MLEATRASDHRVSFETEAWRQTPDSAVWHKSLRAAAWNAHTTEAAKILLANNTRVKVRESAHGIIQTAAVGGREDIPKALLDDDAHLRAQSRDAYSNALRQAMNSENDPVVDFLRDSGVRLAETETDSFRGYG